MERNDPLDELNAKLTIIRDRIAGVAHRHHAGFYLFGRPGTSKTFTVRTTLNSLKVEHEYHAGHLTPMGLFDLLRQFHDRILVLDDVSEIFTNRIALQLFLAALGNQPEERGTRLVKYRRAGVDETIRFTGGIIAISNLSLHSAKILEALKSRVHYLEYAPSSEQMAALMFEVGKSGWHHNGFRMRPAECLEVAKFLVEESQRLKVELDMRMLMDKAFPDFIQCREGNSVAHWKDLVLSSLKEQTVPLIHTAEANSREAAIQQEREIARSIADQFRGRRERVKAWNEQTGKSERAFYRRLKEIGL